MAGWPEAGPRGLPWLLPLLPVTVIMEDRPHVDSTAPPAHPSFPRVVLARGPRAAWSQCCSAPRTAGPLRSLPAAVGSLTRFWPDPAAGEEAGGQALSAGLSISGFVMIT